MDDEIQEFSRTQVFLLKCFFVLAVTMFVAIGSFRLGAKWTGWAICDNNESVVIVAEAWRTIRDSGTKQHVYCVSPGGLKSHDKRLQAGAIYFLMVYLCLVLIFWMVISALRYYSKNYYEKDTLKKND